MPIVNSTRSGNQVEPDIATFSANHNSLPSGHVVVYEDQSGADGSGRGVFAQLFNQNNEPVANVLQVGNNTSGNQLRPSIATLDDGSFIISWQTPSSSSGVALHAQIYHYDGNNIVSVGQEIIVDHAAASMDNDVAEIATLSTGGFALVWQSTKFGTFEIFSRIYDENGHATTGVFQPVSTSYRVQPNITELSDGGLLYTWSTNPSSGRAVYGKIFNSDGTTQTSEFNISTTIDSQFYVENVALDDGGFVSVWHIRNGAVIGRRFDADGTPTTNEYQISSGRVIGDIFKDSDPTATLLMDGSILVTYEGQGNIIGQRISADGEHIDGEFIVNDVTSGTQYNVESALNAKGEVIVTFQSNGTGTNGYDIITQTVDLPVPSATPSPENDLLIGTSGNDIISALEGNDTTYGLTGNDTIFGKNGADVLYGDDGDDWLDGGDDNDTVYGGAGNDTIDGGYAGGDVVDGGDGIDTLSLWRHRGGDMIVDLSMGTGTTTAGDQFTLNRIENVYGSDLGNDHITGTSGDNYLRGIGGNDTLLGADGNDVLEGDAGNDMLDGGRGYDKLYGGDGDDTLDGGANNDTLYGNDGDDVISGGSGNDWLKPSTGSNTVNGGDGNDIFFITAEVSDGNYTISHYDGGDGTDTLDLSQSTIQFSEVSLESWALAGPGSDEFHLSNIENVTGTSGGDYIYGSNASNLIIGNAGNDLITGGDSGNDTLIGGEGYDQLYSGDGADIISGGSGNDFVSGGGGNDSLTGGEGSDIFIFHNNAFHDGWGHDTVMDFNTSEDQIEFYIDNLVYSDILITQQGEDTLIEIANLADNSILLSDTTASDITEANFNFG